MPYLDLNIDNESKGMPTGASRRRAFKEKGLRINET